MYRSKLEERVGDWMEDLGGTYESHKVVYSIPKKYTPDFTFEDYKVHIEIKGWFRSGDRQKYKAISEALWNQGWKLVFVFQNPHKKVAKGAKTTMADWCDNNGIAWFAEEDASGFELWLEEGAPL